MDKVYIVPLGEYGYTENIVQNIMGIPHTHCWYYTANGGKSGVWLESREFFKVKDTDADNKVMV
jgi:hypothetical protein